MILFIKEDKMEELQKRKAISNAPPEMMKRP